LGNSLMSAQRVDGGNRPAFVEKEAADDGSVYLGDQSE
jgi:hypothetical protein